ncbi:hypothetical protein [uncultured Roseibium sp.]|uniref:hypothetical protein n=1 Tax=uncultured Roseibium sp. TaxID=1936171 RepID=UPI0026174404|nr:hypothetical protein [uncultured Roseibium sp.]
MTMPASKSLWVILCMLLAGVGSQQVNASSDDPAEVNDLPGFGIWGPAYRLRNVPEGMRLVVRSAGHRNAATVGSLTRSASEILVLNCAPEIVPLTFEDASVEAKRELLGGVWCQIDHYGMTGFLPGIYLDPILNR